MHVAICIVGFRNADDIRRCLSAVERSSHTDFDVVICENGGADAHRALAAAAPAVLSGGQTVTIVKADRNLGYAGGVNLAMAQSPDADAWWVLNPDTAPEPGALAALVARLAAGDCDAVGGTLYLPDGKVQSYGGLWQTPLGRAVSMGYGAPADAAVDARDIERRQSFLSGASMLIGRRFFETVGPMREDYFLYCEEVEWFLRARGKGMRLGFAPDARVLHMAGTTTGSHEAFDRMPKTPVYLNERNRILLTRDLWPGLAPVVAAGALAVIAARFGRRRAWRQMGFALQGWFAGVANRRGAPAWIPATPA
jgi:GT2 family glycosyltransferase